MLPPWLKRVFARLSLPRERDACLRWAFSMIGFAIVLLAIGRMLEPMVWNLSAFGGHDWDEVTAQRYLVVKSLLEYGQFPFWNPYACGGHPAWGNVQGAPILVSPFLPVYLLADLRYAVRFEVAALALIAALGGWFWAGTFTKNAGARAFVSILFVVNGRWAMQTATGHAWHLYYAYTPWVFFLFDRARGAEPDQAGNVFRIGYLIACAGVLALMVYAGAIYPLPQTALLLTLYATSLAVLSRSFRPCTALAGVAVAALGLAAPKLLPVMERMAKAPRLVESKEAIDLNIFVQALVARGQTVGSRPARIPQWGWHEYGMYIGWGVFLALIAGVWFASTAREKTLRWTGLWALGLGFGAFHELAPWTVLHELPVFRSQHVPTRWLYPAALLFGIVAASVASRALSRIARGHFAAEIATLGLVLLVALDMSAQAHRPMQHAFWMQAPPITAARTFQQYRRVPRHLQYERRDYAPEALLAMHANVGVIDCTMDGGLNIWAPKNERGRPVGLGALGSGDHGYRGEIETLSGEGRARIVEFTPNRILVELRQGKPGDTLILNQNYDEGWRVNGRDVQSHVDRVATRVESRDQLFDFRYRSRVIWPGLLFFALTLAALVFAPRWLTRHRRATLDADADGTRTQ